MLKYLATIFFTLSLVAGPAVATNNAIGESRVLIQPNPAKDYFDVIFSNETDPNQVTIVIFDIIGTPLKDYSSSVIDNKIHITIESFKSGMYVVKMKGPNFLRTERLIVDKN